MSQKRKSRITRGNESSAYGFSHGYEFVFSSELPVSKCSLTKAKRDAKKAAGKASDSGAYEFGNFNKMQDA